MKILALAKRIIEQIVRDKRTLALIFIAPLMILWLFSIILIDGSTNVLVGLVDVPQVLEETFDNADINIKKYDNVSIALEGLRNKEIDGYITFKDNTLIIKLEGSDLAKNREILKEVQNALKANDDTLEVEYLYGQSGMNMFDTTGPVFLGFFAFFFVFILSGISFIRERLTGTLERVLVSPIRKLDIVLGYVLGFGVFAIIQSILITYFTVDVLGMYNIGNLFSVMVVTCIISLTALTLGTFLSAFAHNEFQILQFIPIVIVPQIFFSGMFPIDNLPKWFIILGKIFPLTYGTDILRNIMFKGEHLVDNLLYILILLLFSIVFITLNMLALRKIRSS